MTGIASSSPYHNVDIAAVAEVVATDDESDSDSSYDACDEIFRQGDYLRRLREMEREDEALREKERQEQAEDNDSNSNTLDYNHYLRNQEGMYDDYKHVNYQYIDFGVIDSGDASVSEIDNTGATTAEPLVIEQDRTVGKGGFVWDAGFILAESVLRMEREETKWLRSGQKTRIIELGAGTGVTSLMIARARPQATVHLTDLPVLQPLLSKNCSSCCPATATYGVLEWGKPVGVENAGAYDVILGSDVVAGIYDSSGLAKTIYDLSHEKTVVYLAYRDRLTGLIDLFISHMQKLFTNIERRDADSSNRTPNLYILRLSGKRVYDDETAC